MSDSLHRSERLRRALRDVVVARRIERCAVITDDGFVLACAPEGSQSLGVGETWQRLLRTTERLGQGLLLGSIGEVLVLGERASLMWLRLGPSEILLGIVSRTADLAWFQVEMRKVVEQLRD